MAVLYNPFGSKMPHGVSVQYGYTLQPGVDFKEHIVNSQSYKSVGGNTSVVDESVLSGTSSSGANVSTGGGTNKIQDFSVAGGRAMTLPEISRGYNSYGESGSGNGSFIAGGASRRNLIMSPGNSGSIPTGDLTRLSQNLGIPNTGDAGADHTGGSSYGDGATDPGTDPDEETVIPVGGNEIYLAIMALLYITLKTRFFKRKTT